MFLTPSDFTGFYRISGNSHSTADLTDYINNIEPKVLQDLFGVELYNLFIADLVGGVPQSQRFIDVFNAFGFDNGGDIVRSDGIKEMLKGFVYYNYVRDSDFFNTIAGNVKHNFSNSSKVRNVEYGLNERYNRAIESYCSIQYKMIIDNATYPEFNGQLKEIKHWL